MNPTKLMSVRVLENKMVRVGQGLLGKLAGRRDLRFNIRFNGKKPGLILTPSTKPPGWSVTYYGDDARSPYVSLVPFLKLYALPETYFPTGEFEVTKDRKGNLVINFDRPISEK